MKSKFLNIGLVLSSMIGYLQWGKDNRMFLFEAEWEILGKLFTNPSSAIHPFTLLPLFGQLLLIFTLFQNVVSKKLTLIGLSCIGILLVLMFIIGLISLNWKILLSTIPFIFLGTITIIHCKNKEN